MKVVIIGSGPGGYVAAIRLAQLGAEVVLIEKKYIGGTCLNVGCIPTKVLLHTAEIVSMLNNEAKELGINIDSFNIEMEKLHQRKEMVVNQLVNGIETLLSSHKIRTIRGKAVFENNKEIKVDKEDGSIELIKFEKAIIATGSQPAIIPLPGIESSSVITSDEALELKEIPESMVIIGGGVIGCEFANIFSSLGTKTTIIEMMDNIIFNMDEDVVNVLKAKFEKDEVKIHTSSKVLRIKENDNLLEVEAEGSKGVFKVSGEKVLLSIGRKPSIMDIGLENTSIELEKGFIKTDKNMRTNQRNIYAIGDCKGGALLAHTASAEGIVAAEDIMGIKSDIDFRTTPFCVYTKPEISGVGMTEKEAKNLGYNTGVGIFPLYANGKSIIMGEESGIVKFVTDKDTDEILGLHMVGPRATDLIVEGALAIRLEATIDEIITTIHAHPTIGEALHEAAHAVHKNAIHIPNK